MSTATNPSQTLQRTGKKEAMQKLQSLWYSPYSDRAADPQMRYSPRDKIPLNKKLCIYNGVKRKLVYS